MSAANTVTLLAGRYQLAQRIAGGGFGEVWRGTDVVLARPVAVKLLRRELAGDAEMLARFRDEARHAGSLVHEGIARIYDYVEPGSPHPPFLVMEFVEGPSLAQLVADGPLEPARAMDVVAQAAAALATAHQAGLVHRDIKPGNVLVRRDGVVKLTDFGIAAAAWSEPVTAPGAVLGTPGYLAPERVNGARGTAAGDLYALGIVAYQCLAGRLPFSGPPVAVALAHRDRPLPALPAGVPAEVAALIAQLTAKDPADRPGTADEVARRAGELRDRMMAGSMSPADIRPAVVPVARAGDVIPLADASQEPPEVPTRPWRWAGRRWHGRVPKLAAAATGTAGAAALLVSLTGLGLHHAALVPAKPKASPQSVAVDGSALRGRPVEVVRMKLRHLGLEVRVRWRPSSQLPPGDVLAVRPSGHVAAGTTVVIVGALRPEDTAPGPGTPGGSGHTAPGPHRRGNVDRSSRPRPPATPSPTGSPGPTGSPSPTGSPGPTTSPTPAPGPSTSGPPPRPNSPVL